MPAPTRSVKHVYILVPDTDPGLEAQRRYVLSLQRASRIAYLTGHTPVVPFLYYQSILSPGEFQQDRRRLELQWLQRTDRIWLYNELALDNAPIDLDPVAYNILSGNSKMRVRRPVYLLEPNPYDPNGLTPLSLSRSEISDILDTNVHAMLAACA